jgi:hypothetical protein
VFRQMKRLAAIILLLFAVGTAHAQTKFPAETRNAALRYWLAFADLQDPPADKATAELLERTAAGEAAWDEAKLGPILDKNETAILKMQRATKLPECDWGLEYSLGPRASIAYVPKARVLARLNTLYGMRLAAKGDTQKAMESWLAGIRFSQHLASGGSLIFALIGKMGMMSNFRALTQAALSGALSGEQKKQIEAAVRALPETGFDWGQAFWYEQDPLNVAVKQVAEATNPSAYYQELTGKPAPENFTVPNASEIAAFHRLMASVEEALRLPPDAASPRLKTLQDSVKTLHPFYQELIPSFKRVNDSRVELQTAKAELLKALVSK